MDGVYIETEGSKMSSNKHLTLSDRVVINEMLTVRSTFKEIGLALNKDATTISKEVRKHQVVSNTGAIGRALNRCIHRRNCNITHLCETECRYKKCSICSYCNSKCNQFEEEICVKFNSSPYVCNGCKQKRDCVLRKHFYDPIAAQESYQSNLSVARTGFNINEEDVLRLNKVLIPLVQKNQSIHHICINNKDELMTSERTIYRLVESNALTVRNIDLPRKVKYRARIKAKSYKVDKACTSGRTYEDYLRFIEENNDLPIVEMDTVEGVKGGSVLLTIHFLNCNLQLAFIREANTSQSVIDVFNKLYKMFGHDTFVSLFPVILTDNGSEFSNPKAIEFNENKERRTRIFYCKPSTPGQKGSCEKNHVEMRKILPKGTSFNHLTQDQINLVMSHVNSYTRKKLNDKSPHFAFSSLYNKEILDQLDIKPIDPNSVTLKPELLK